MRLVYRGHEIDVHRARSLGGDVLAYMSVFRVEDGYECMSDFTSGTDTVRALIAMLKARVDEELASSKPWNEEASA